MCPPGESTINTTPMLGRFEIDGVRRVKKKKVLKTQLKNDGEKNKREVNVFARR